MHGRYLLDTNIIIALFASDQDVLKHLAKAEEVFLSSIAMGEMYYGARKSMHASANLKRLDSFVLHGEVLSCDVETAQHYGVIKSYLRKKGRPIPENDIWLLNHGDVRCLHDSFNSEIRDTRADPSFFLCASAHSGCT